MPRLRQQKLNVICAHMRIPADQRETFTLTLGNQHSIKWVAMVIR